MVKRESAIATAGAEGIDLFAFDGAGELEKRTRSAPGTRAFCRMLVENKGTERPLARKFGCEAHMAVDLLILAKQHGLRPVGVSFHAGSQQIDLRAWKSAITHAAWIFRACKHRGLTLELLNLGGGLSASHRAPVPSLAVHAEAIERALMAEFGGSRPHILIEPGRYLTGDAGLLRTEILLISHKLSHGGEGWIYLDAGLYNGLDETLDEHVSADALVTHRVLQVRAAVIDGRLSARQLYVAA